MNIHASSPARPEVRADSLSEVLQDFRLSGVSYGRCELRDPWGLEFPAEPLLRLHFVAEGTCWLFTDELGWQELLAGALVLLPQGAAHRITSTPEGRCRPIDPENLTGHGGNVCTVRQDGDGTPAILFCGTMSLESHAMHPLIASMPSVIKACDVIDKDSMVGPLLEAMRSEAGGSNIGGATILTRMAELLAARIIRCWVNNCDVGTAGWLAAIRDPQIGRALAAIHRDPGKAWTLESLARIAGQSRSVFAEKFAQVMGEGAAHYVARWRMQLAQEWLKGKANSIASVSSRLGYESEASFSRAFKRIIGKTPGEARSAKDSGRKDNIFGQ